MQMNPPIVKWSEHSEGYLKTADFVPFPGCDLFEHETFEPGIVEGTVGFEIEMVRIGSKGVNVFGELFPDRLKVFLVIRKIDFSRLLANVLHCEDNYFRTRTLPAIRSTTLLVSMASLRPKATQPRALVFTIE